jgi:alkanesulfonate monooxygenase SsuD/methylene tetrahydromethanopterin reductase-like flavin-dependent oxidoreductase (luciferase family)
MEIRLGVILLPLYHPVRLAEDLAVLDLLAEGRLRITVGMGYREEEYDQFDQNIKRRPSLMEEGVDVLKQAWTGEPFEWRGHTIRVLPRPFQHPRPAITMGGSSRASAERARASPTATSRSSHVSTTSTSKRSMRWASRTRRLPVGSVEVER